MEPEYEDLRKLAKTTNYELIYEKLSKEILNIKSKELDFQDISNIKIFIDEEIRDRIFKKRGIPTYVFKIMILFGNEYEVEMKQKINNLLIFEYVTDFQLFIGKEFNNLKDIKKYYTKINQLILELENVYFNLPNVWNTKYEIINEIFMIIKQKICDIIFFNNFEDVDFFECANIVINNEHKIIGILQDNKKSIFHLLAPFTKKFFIRKLDDKKFFEFDIKKIEMKIFTNVVLFFQKFEFLNREIDFFKNLEAIKNLAEAFETNLVLLVKSLSKIFLTSDYEIENNFNYWNKDFIKIITTLNTISYLNDCVSGFNSNLFCSYKINLSQDLFFRLGNIENKFNNLLETYIRNLIINTNLKTKNLSNLMIKIFQENIFFIDLSDLCEDVKNNLIEIIVLQILSKIYLLDFDEQSAELMIYELHDLKKFLNEYFCNMKSFTILESYLKIFMCSTEDKKTFIENFHILSNDIFSFRQIVWSLKDKDCVISLLELFEKIEQMKEES